MTNNKFIILFDGICSFCNFWVDFLIVQDKKDRFRFTAFQSEKGKELLKKYNLSREDFETFVLIDGNKYYIKSTAALLVLKNLSGLWKILYVFIIVPGSIRDFVYSFIAKHRYKIFGKRKTCRVPTLEERNKFF